MCCHMRPASMRGLHKNSAPASPVAAQEHKSLQFVASEAGPSFDTPAVMRQAQYEDLAGLLDTLKRTVEVLSRQGKHVVVSSDKLLVRSRPLLASYGRRPTKILAPGWTWDRQLPQAQTQWQLALHFMLSTSISTRQTEMMCHVPAGAISQCPSCGELCHAELWQSCKCG